MPSKSIRLPQDLANRFSKLGRDLGMSLAEAAAFLVKNAKPPIHVVHSECPGDAPGINFFGQIVSHVSAEDVRDFARDLERVAARPGSVCNPVVGISATHQGESVLLWCNSSSTDSSEHSVSCDWISHIIEELRWEADIWDDRLQAMSIALAEEEAAEERFRRAFPSH